MPDGLVPTEVWHRVQRRVQRFYRRCTLDTPCVYQCFRQVGVWRWTFPIKTYHTTPPTGQDTTGGLRFSEGLEKKSEYAAPGNALPKQHFTLISADLCAFLHFSALVGAKLRFSQKKSGKETFVFSPLFYIFKYKCFVISFFFINFATFLQVLHLHDITKKKIYQ